MVKCQKATFYILTKKDIPVLGREELLELRVQCGKHRGASDCNYSPNYCSFMPAQKHKKFMKNQWLKDSPMFSQI